MADKNMGPDDKTGVLARLRQDLARAAREAAGGMADAGRVLVRAFRDSQKELFPRNEWLQSVSRTLGEARQRAGAWAAQTGRDMAAGLGRGVLGVGDRIASALSRRRPAQADLFDAAGSERRFSQAMGRIGASVRQRSGEIRASLTGALQSVESRLSGLGPAFGRIAGAGRTAFGAFGTAVGGVLARVNPAALAAQGARALASFGAASVQAAMKSQAAWSRLGLAMKKSGTDLSAKQDELNARAREFTKNTTFSTDQYVEGLTRMIGVTGDYDSSVRNMALAADVAAKRNIDLSSAAELVGKVAQADAAALEEMGIKSGSATEGLAKLSEECGGFAKNQASTLDGKVQQLNNSWGDFKTAVGNAMIEAGGGTSVMDTLRGVLVTVTDAFVRNKDQIVAWAQVGIAVIVAAATNVGSVIRILFNVGQAVGNLVQIIFYGVEGLVLGAVNKVIQGINWAIEKLNTLPGVKISLLDTLDDRLQRNRANLTGAMGDLKGQVNDIESAIGASVRASENVLGKLGNALSASGSGKPAAAAREVRQEGYTAAPPKKQQGTGGKAAGTAGGGGAASPAEVPTAAPAAAECACDPAEAAAASKGVSEETREQVDAREKLVALQEKELRLLERAAEMGEDRTEALELARKLQDEITDALKEQNLSTAAATGLRERLNRVSAVRTGLEAAAATRLARKDTPGAEQPRQDKAGEKPPKRVEDFSLGRLGKAANAAKGLLQKMEAGASQTGAKMANAMSDAFGKMLSGAASVGEVLDALWKSMARGALEAIGAKAKGRAGESAADAITETALGISAAVTPGRQAEAAGHFAAAGQHLAAAAAWSALAGGMGAAAGAVGGGGGASGSGAPRSSRDAGGAVAERAERRGPEIHVYVDGIDPTNPRHQKLTHETMKGIRERYGSDGTVTYAARRA